MNIGEQRPPGKGIQHQRGHMYYTNTPPARHRSRPRDVGEKVEKRISSTSQHQVYYDEYQITESQEGSVVEYKEHSPPSGHRSSRHNMERYADEDMHRYPSRSSCHVDHRSCNQLDRRSNASSRQDSPQVLQPIAVIVDVMNFQPPDEEDHRVTQPCRRCSRGSSVNSASVPGGRSTRNSER
ncbi:hypothetical protein MRX96_037259 [Rhipicephalus microplus]